MEDREFRPVVVAPTYNNVRTLGDIITRTQALGLPVLVVNDGSTDGTAELLAAWSGQPLTVVTHAVNRGKAAALQTGFAAARQAGYTHAASIDTDGQLDPEQIPALLDAARANPAALVVGCRNDRADDYPARSRVGRRVSNLLVRLESGVRVGDSLCGFRVYPLAFVAAVPCRVGHFGFET
jgi:glycosyltransferase involved in cell wall biosynthesis